jgi:hypothetical protein
MIIERFAMIRRPEAQWNGAEHSGYGAGRDSLHQHQSAFLRAQHLAATRE